MLGNPTSDILLDPALQSPANDFGGYGRHERATQSSVRQRRGDELQAQRRLPFQVDKAGDILQDYDLAIERGCTWTGISRFGFNAMLASSEYKNKLRLSSDKAERIIHFLTTPDAKSREKDRTDAQIKHQAQHWMYENGTLYRKDSRLQQSRRHVSANEVFDILTAEHMRSGHHGRDKMLKALQVKYIGYTKDELMYILDHCLVCASKHIRGAAGRRKENKHLGGEIAPRTA